MHKPLSHTCGDYYPCDKHRLYHKVLYQELPVGTTFDTVPRFNTSMTYTTNLVTDRLVKQYKNTHYIYNKVKNYSSLITVYNVNNDRDNSKY